MVQKLKVNDIVKVILGAQKGQTAKIVKIDRETGRAFLENIGVRERHLKKSYMNPMGGKKSVHLGIDCSNLKLEKAAEYQKPKTAKAAKAAKASTKKGTK